MFINTISPAGIETLKQMESCVLRAYKCSAGVWTIGYGHTSAAGLPKVTSNLTITKEEASKLLRQDLEKYEGRVANNFHTKHQNEFDAAVLFDYNTGKIDSASWVKLFLEGEQSKARASFNLWVKAGGKRIQGLVNRRAFEAAILFDNVYPGGGLSLGDIKAPSAISRGDIVQAQKMLTARGFNPGAVDGIMGSKTKQAILAYQQNHPKLTNDGVLGLATINQLSRDVTLANDTVTAITKKGGPLSIISGLGSFLLGLPWEWILPLVVVGVSGYFAYRNWDTIEARFNKLFNRKVS